MRCNAERLTEVMSIILINEECTNGKATVRTLAESEERVALLIALVGRAVHFTWPRASASPRSHLRPSIFLTRPQQ